MLCFVHLFCVLDTGACVAIESFEEGACVAVLSGVDSSFAKSEAVLFQSWGDCNVPGDF